MEYRNTILTKKEREELLKFLVEEKNLNAIKLYLEYRFGKPKDEVTAIIQKDDFNIKDLIRFTD